MPLHFPATLPPAAFRKSLVSSLVGPLASDFCVSEAGLSLCKGIAEGKPQGAQYKGHWQKWFGQ